MSPDATRELQIARLIYPIYRALIERFELEMFSCRDLDQEPTADPEVLNRIRLWFSEADKHIEVAHIRQYLQSIAVQEVVIRALIFSYLQKQEKTDSDRYKLDFLLGHYLAQNMPPDVLNQGDVKLSQVAHVLAPVLGDQGHLSFLEELDGWVRELQSCEHVQDLIDRKILEKGKHLKTEAGARYFHQAAMIAFTRFNFLARRCLIKLLATDLDEIGQALSELQLRGMQSIDCSAAGLAANESPTSLRERIKQWRKPFQGKYSEVGWLEQISKMRDLLKSAVEQQPAQPQAGQPEPAIALAAEPAVVPPPQPKPVATPPVQIPRPSVAAPAAPTHKPVVAADPAPPAASVAAAKGPAQGPPPSPRQATTARRPPQKPFAVLLQEQSKSLYALVGGWVGALRVQALELWNRIREALSEERSEATQAPNAAAQSTPAAQAKTPSGRIVQPSAQVRDAIKRISEQAAVLPADTDASITVQEINLSLNAREVNAFRRPHDNLSGILQRSVGVRLILMEALKKAESSDSAGLNPTLKFAYAELAMLQDRVTHARSNKDIDGAMQLAGCQRSLQLLVDRVEVSLERVTPPV
jgi:hypothetical protein